jgi:hypothetical protein
MTGCMAHPLVCRKTRCPQRREDGSGASAGTTRALRVEATYGGCSAVTPPVERSNVPNAE